MPGKLSVLHSRKSWQLAKKKHEKPANFLLAFYKINKNLSFAFFNETICVPDPVRFFFCLHFDFVKNLYSLLFVTLLYAIWYAMLQVKDVILLICWWRVAGRNFLSYNKRFELDSWIVEETVSSWTSQATAHLTKCPTKSNIRIRSIVELNCF